ncbi:MAG: hypothetical protein QOK43_3292 [Acidimicrobiaceae bacterium]|nr:hypothetical protein [Acidimicrobiaceae bacterium]
MKRVLLVLTLVSLLAAGCGSDKKQSVNAKSTSTTAGSSTGGTDANGNTTTTAKGSKAKGSKGSTTTVKPGSGTDSGGTGSTTTTTKAPFPVVMKLDKECVRKGATGDAQALNVTTRPDDTVAYSTEYADHSNELSHPQWQKVGGSGYGKASTDGKYRAEWHVPDDAPDGTATLHVIADGRIQPPITFKVVGLTAHC